MATQNPELFSGITAAADLSTKQFYGVKLTADRAVNIATAGAVFAVLQNKPKLGEAAALTNSGIVKCISGGVIAAGDKISTDANGKFVKITLASPGTLFTDCIGIALEAAALN